MSKETPPSIDSVLHPLTLLQYGWFKTVLGRIPSQTPRRFEIVSRLLFTQHSLDVSADTLQAVYDKLIMHYGADAELDREVRDSMDNRDYGLHSVVAIPSVGSCMTCGGKLVVVDQPSKVFFYRLSEEAVDRGSAYYKMCPNEECCGGSTSTNVKYWYSYFLDSDGKKRVYIPEDSTSFDGYDGSEWYQLSRETFFETKLLKDVEHGLIYSHVGFLPRCRIYNATHQLRRTFIPQLPGHKKTRGSGGIPRSSSSGTSVGTTAPPPPPPPPPPPLPPPPSSATPITRGWSAAAAANDTPATSISNKNQKRTHRYQLNRKLVQKGLFERRVCLFVNEIAPWLRSEIELGFDNLDLVLMQVRAY
jgi:hypothetical protein